jgi:hypothetical protein
MRAGSNPERIRRAYQSSARCVSASLSIHPQLTGPSRVPRDDRAPTPSLSSRLTFCRSRRNQPDR